MGWLWRRRRAVVPKRHISGMAGLAVADRRALFAGRDGPAWIEAAAGHGLVEAQVLHGQVLLDAGQPGLALRWFQAAAEAGHPPAINMLGRCAELGWGMPPDLAQAARHYRRAAEAGSDWGAFNLGCLLLYGLGTVRDRVEAYACYLKAAGQGHAKAMNMLARFHEEGWDRPVDPAEAASWYHKGAEAGDFRAQYNWATLLATQGRTDAALAWLDRAFATGSPDFLAQAAAALRAHPDPALRAFAARVSLRPRSLPPAPAPGRC